ncbi:hypothetical protein F8388_022614 [Cannabis sativa]|uniref:Uncharacterized protein n=1 Tax=Cannabis sativa TaxID=3483 RepID=A0A7J6FZC2_CANSA|nr:hypothetical protein F8388_022614 [Cannabis sativa]
MEDYCLIANVSALHSISTDVSAYNPMENRVLGHLQRDYSFAHKYAVGNIIAIQSSRTAKFIDHRGIEAIMTLDHGVLLLPLQLDAISSCNGPCRTLNDCDGQLICINGKCNDDPDIGTNICGGGGGGSGTCKSSGTLTCGAKSYPKYKCSPQVTSSTSAKLTNNDFSEGGDGGGPSECDERYHSNDERVVSLSTGWYNDRSRCGKIIKIRATNGRTTTAKVVDECDSQNGCDDEHVGQPPCRNNIVDGSNAV